MITANTAGVLSGDVSALRTNTLYKLGNGNFLAIFADATGKTPDFAVFKPTPEKATKFECIEHELSRDRLPFAEAFKEKISKSGGSLVPASSEELNALLHDAVTNHPTLADAAETYAKLGEGGKAVKLPPHIDPYVQHSRIGKLSGGSQNSLEQHIIDELGSIFPLGRETPEAGRLRSRAGAVGDSVGREVNQVASHSAGSESAISRFLREEKWMGKKGLAFAGAAVALGATVLVVNKLAHEKERKNSR